VGLGLSGGKPKGKHRLQKEKSWLKRSKYRQIWRIFAALFAGKPTKNNGFSARGAKTGHMKTDGSYYFCDTRAHEKVRYGYVHHVCILPILQPIILFILFFVCRI
jgi:hypothetical protein